MLPNKLRVYLSAAAVCLLLQAAVSAAQETKSEEDFKIESGFTSLFNGKDLTGWNILPTTERQKKSRANWQKNPEAPPWPIYEEKIDFDGKTQSEDGRFVAQDGCLVVTVPAEGRKVQMLYTKQEFAEDFTLKLEFRAATNADSGVFVRGKQLQCRDYPNAGPYKKLKNFKANDWNELVIVVKGESAHCTCNGEVLEESMKVPANGPMGIEGDNGKIEYRRIRISDSSFGLLKPTSKSDSWTFEVTDDAKGEVKETGDSITFVTSKIGNENWHVQAFQGGLSLEENATYTIKFEMKSPQRVTVGIQAMINQEDWHQIGLQEEIYTGGEFEEYEYTFTATEVDKGGMNRIGFTLGEEEGSVSIKNMVLTKD